MRALSFALLLGLTILLPACEPEQKSVAAKAVTKVLATPPGGTRKAEIRRQLAALCPVPLTEAELNMAADYLSAHADALQVITALDRLDQEAHICRKGKP